MKVYQFEGAVWKQEGVRIVVRAPSGARVETYGSKPRDRDSRTVAEFLRNRVRPLIGDYEVCAVNGNGSRAHGATQMSTIRASCGR